VHAERISYHSFQRAFGRSVRDRAPGRFIAELARKAERQGGKLVEIPTAWTFLSQRCVCGRRERKSLSDRRHRCACQHVGSYVDRDELAAFLACFCDQHGNFDQQAALSAWQGGADDRLLRTWQVREPAAKPQERALGRAARPAGRSGSAGKRQRTPVTPRHTRVRGKPRRQRRHQRVSTGVKPPGLNRGDH